MKTRWAGLLPLMTVMFSSFTREVEAEPRSPAPLSERRLLPGPYPVGTWDLSLVDPTRPTARNKDFPGSPVRTFQTTIWYPAERRSLEPLRASPAPLARAGRPFPLVIYSHGFMSFRTEGRYLAEHLASRGYIVVAANYPLTNYFSPGGPFLGDVIHQPNDVSFLIDTLLRWSGDGVHPFAAAVDAKRIAVVGLSLGGMTSTMAAYHPGMRDARIAAAVSIAGPASMFSSAFYRNADVPFLMVAGDLDCIVHYQDNAGGLLERAPNATLVTVKGASHTGFADIAALLFRWSDNPDRIGCSQMRRHLPTRLDELGQLGDEEQGIVTAAPRPPCEGTQFSHAMRPARQHVLTTLAVSSFLEALFAPGQAQREESRTFLQEILPQENPDLAVSPRGDPRASVE